MNASNKYKKRLRRISEVKNDKRNIGRQKKLPLIDLCLEK